MFGVVGVAWGCGGLMCDPAPTPIVQVAEQVAFLVDEAAGEVEAHVRISYEGPPDAFAWVIPVAAQPEVFLSSEWFFTMAGRGLAPRIQLDRVTEGVCRGERELRSGCARQDVSFSSDSGDPGGPGGPVVVAEGVVGPYDHVVLTATGEAELVEWLQTNGYAVPDGLSAALAPYVVPGGHFVAVRLSKDRDTGDIAPLALRYPADAASIPIQLTAIATAPDLRLEVSVFGAHRAVPESYLHVAINEANLDWFGGGQNYYDLIAAAADQAGGHAFATDYAGPSDILPDVWDDEQEARFQELVAATDPTVWHGIRERLFLGVPDDGVDAALSPWAGGQIPAEELPLATARLDAFVFEPLRRAQVLLDQPYVTRMSSSLDAAEMTVDPVFVLNPDLPDVSNLHTATLVTDCRGNEPGREHAPRRLELSDGRTYALPPSVEVPDDSAFWAAERSDVEALRIEITGRHGLPEVIVDLTEELRADAASAGAACGCRTAPPGSFALSLLVVLGISRRRRA